jgi:ABC-type multidrug transport system, ATPase and permease components
MASDETGYGQSVKNLLQDRRGGRPGKFEKARDPKRVILRLAFYLKPYAPSLITVTVFIVAYSLLSLCAPWLMGIAIDRFVSGDGLAAKDRHGGLAWIAGFMLIAYLLANGFQAAANWIMARVSQNALRETRRDLFEQIQTLPMSFFDTHGAGGLMSRLTNDIDAINQAVSQNVTALLASVLSMAGILAAMFVLNHWLALASLIVVPLMFAFTRFVAVFTRKGFRDLQKNLGELNGVAEEAVSGAKVIQAFGRKNSVIEDFRAKNNAVFEAGVRANSYALLLMPLTAALGNFFVIVVASLGGWFALKGVVTVGIIATFINYGQNFVSPLRQLANLYNSIQAALAGAERVFEVIDTESEIDGASSAGAVFRGDVSMRDVVFSYVKGYPVVRNFSLEVKAGQTIALVGPTGAGKTTIINLLTRFYEIDSGSICIDGTDIRDIGKKDLRRNLGLVLQDTFLFSDTVLENIRYGRLEASDGECIEAARLSEADHFIRQLPNGYSESLSERAGNLSQGQRQLLSISRAILADPAILILDEATSSVDTRTEARIQKALLTLMKGRTCFVIAHRLSTIRDADLVVVINEGKILETGTHQSLLDRRGFYHHLYMSQFKGKEI